ncbi:hypothetical protein B0H17DRAFT_1089327 [Mycena rosella]|uniref:Uncharacterized protein n=1 Tax=Mycena rosella TaxID=1033263 RepID=A0AAD7G8Q7_MYCRO|nr:hypothetical protein B0H17DRAFT_1089327 [Mycena rosella]
MIIPEPDDKTDKGSSQYFPVPGYYPTSAYVPSSSNAHSSSPGGRSPSDSLRPPNSWPANASDAALPFPAAFPPLSRTASPSAFSAAPPQPPSLSRPPPPNLPRTPFAPMFLFATENSLKQGFPCVLPPSASTPHPFATYDVHEPDWAQFLDDMRTVARLTPQDIATAYSVPILSAVPIINLALASAITHHIQRKKPRLVSLLVDKWNHHFFHPRKMEVILMRGQTKLSGQSDQPVAHLYTPRTVSFTPPPVDAAFPTCTSKAPSSPSSNPSSPGGEGSADSDGQSRGERERTNRDRDKTWRLFVVSMEA